MTLKKIHQTQLSLKHSLNTKIKILEEKFKRQDIYFVYDGLIKVYDIKKTRNLTIEQLRIDLIAFVQALKSEELEPVS